MKGLTLSIEEIAAFVAIAMSAENWSALSVVLASGVYVVVSMTRVQTKASITNGGTPVYYIKVTIRDIAGVEYTFAAPAGLVFSLMGVALDESLVEITLSSELGRPSAQSPKGTYNYTVKTLTVDGVVIKVVKNAPKAATAKAPITDLAQATKIIMALGSPTQIASIDDMSTKKAIELATELQA